MADNIDKEHLDNPINIQSENPSDKISPVTDKEPISLNQEPENMEVHHHPHMEKKRFKEYLLEGLMIFLAVTMGFIAENIREHITENKIAAELAESLYKEVYSDSINIKQEIDGRVNFKERDVNHFISYITDSSLTNPSGSFYNAVFLGFLRNYSFEPKDGILNQLRNSGSLRYMKSNLLQDEIGKLSVTIAEVRIRNATEREFITSTSRPFLLKYFDYTWFTYHAFQDKSKPVIPQLFNTKEFNKNEAINIASAWLMIIRSTREVQYKVYADVNHQLLEILRNEYNVKNE